VPAFRQKMDVVPGRYTYYYVKPIKDGIFRVFCTEYCGDNHSGMKTWCHVHKSDAVRKEKTQWITKDHKAWENGERLFKLNCAGCHNVNGVAATGPALNTIWGMEETLIDGTKVKVDENYISESIKYPNAKVVSGYGPVSKMQTFEGKLSNQDIDFVIAYLKHLKQPGSGDELKAAAPSAETPAAPAEPKQEPAAEQPAPSPGAGG
jgi:cytochrome c oxidase subunit 2